MDAGVRQSAIGFKQVWMEHKPMDVHPPKSVLPTYLSDRKGYRKNTVAKFNNYLKTTNLNIGEVLNFRINTTNQ